MSPARNAEFRSNNQLTLKSLEKENARNCEKSAKACFSFGRDARLSVKMPMTHSFIQFQSRPTTIKGKWQTEPFTEKVLVQLQQEPEVAITRESVAQSPESTYDVLDLCDIAKEVELCFGENTNTPNSRTYTANCSDDNADTTVEKELDKMFADVDEPKKAKLTTCSSPKRRLSKKQETLYRLFGSTLEDLESDDSEPKKICKEERRASLPVSLTLKPLRVSRKRASDPVPTITKVKKIHSVTIAIPQSPNIHFTTAPELIVPPVYPATARRIETELKKAMASKKPVLGEAKTVAAKKSITTIDLTDDDDVPMSSSVMTFDGIRVEVLEAVKKEPSEASHHSEKANVPVSLSMPLLSPVSPAVPAQPEAILPQGTVQTRLWRPEVATIASKQQPPPEPQKKTVADIPDIDSLMTLQQYSMALQQQLQAKKTQQAKQDVRKANHSACEELARKERQMSAMRSRGTMQYNEQQHTQRLTQSIVCGMQQHVAHSMASGLHQQVAHDLQHQAAQSVANGLRQEMTRSVANSLQHHMAQSVANGIQQVAQSAASRHQPQRKTSAPHVTVTSASAIPAWLQNQQQKSTQAAPQPSTYAWSMPNPAQQQRPANPIQLLTSQHIPPLMQLLQSSPPPQLISNSACAEKILPHLVKIVSWRKSVYEYVEHLRKFLTQDELKEDAIKFCEYSNFALHNFGKKLVADLSSVEVKNLDFNGILSLLSAKMMTLDANNNMHRLCTLMNMVFVKVESECTTPFLRRLLGDIKTCNARIEEMLARRRDALQLQQLEGQIRAYWAIQAWLNNQSKGQRQASARVASPCQPVDNRRQQKTAEARVTQQNTLPRNDVEIIAIPLSTNPQGQRRSSSAQDNFQPIVLPVQTPEANGLRSVRISRDPSLQISVVNTQETRNQNPDAIGTSVPDQSANPTAEPQCNNQEALPELTDVQSAVKLEVKTETSDVIIDLTWIEDANDEAIDDIIEYKAFPFKIEDKLEIAEVEESTAREAISPTDSGLGSPVQVQTDNDCLKCLCGNQAKYVCACNSSMYCSSNCQERDWAYHQRLCHKMKS